MKTKWLIKDAPNPIKVEALKQELNVSEVVAYMLIQRGITNRQAAKSFFRGTLEELHDPFLMKDMDKAVARINQAIKKKEKILIYGDYDVDGTTAVALVFSFLSNYTSAIDYYIPNRYHEGYGVSEQGIRFAAENGFSLIITLDCGIKAVAQTKLAKSFGIDVIVCDHHTPGTELPEAILLDPKRTDCEYPYKGLSGCGVGFKLMQALVITNNWDEKLLFDNLDLLAISIGADIVPVTGENRLLAQFGLKQINESKNPRIGIARMLHLAKKEKPLTLTDVVFIIAPRINAAGRIDDAQKAVELMISNDKSTVYEIAETIHQFNEERRSLDKQTTEEALSFIENDTDFSIKNTTVVYHESWHKGIVGIVASRLIEHYYRPTIVLTKSSQDDLWTGSARSIGAINIYEILEKCSRVLEKFGGHDAAAGLSVTDKNLSPFIALFEKEVAQIVDEETLIPEQLIEKELPFEQLFSLGESVLEVPRLMRILKQFEPHGPENMKPLFLAKNVYAHESRLLKGEHLKMKVFQPNFQKHIEAIYFYSPESLEIVQQGPFDLVFTLAENQFKGKSTPQLIVKDLRPTEGE